MQLAAIGLCCVAGPWHWESPLAMSTITRGGFTKQKWSFRGVMGCLGQNLAPYLMSGICRLAPEVHRVSQLLHGAHQRPAILGQLQDTGTVRLL